ncbi:hypothetical protein Tco_0668923 [Tanacetum coccineum]
MESIQDMSGCGANQKGLSTLSGHFRNGSLRKNTKKRGNGRELSRDGNAKDDNKRSRTGRAFATVTNPVRKEYMGTAPKAGPKMVTPLNARNPTTARGACFECGGRGNNGNQERKGAFMMGSKEPKHYDGNGLVISTQGRNCLPREGVVKSTQRTPRQGIHSTKFIAMASVRIKSLLNAVSIIVDLIDVNVA